MARHHERASYPLPDSAVVTTGRGGEGRGGEGRGGGAAAPQGAIEDLASCLRAGVLIRLVRYQAREATGGSARIGAGLVAHSGRCKAFRNKVGIRRVGCP